MPQRWRRVSEGTAVAAGGDFVEFSTIVVSTCQALLDDPGGLLSDKLSGQQDLVSFSNILNQKGQNILQKNKRNKLHTIYLKIVRLRYL